MSNPATIMPSDDVIVHANQGYQRFIEALRTGELSLGMTITQSELCAALSLSLSPLRETLVLLEEHGLVEVRPRAGIRIVEPDVAFIRENYQFRSIIEVDAIRCFIEAVSPDWIARMRQTHAQLHREMAGEAGRETAIERFGRLDHLFHRSIVEAVDNAAILATHNRLQSNISLARIAHNRILRRKAYMKAIDQHLAIIDHLEKGDLKGAVDALEDHFHTSAYQDFVTS